MKGSYKDVCVNHSGVTKQAESDAVPVSSRESSRNQASYVLFQIQAKTSSSSPCGASYQEEQESEFKDSYTTAVPQLQWRKLKENRVPYKSFLPVIINKISYSYSWETLVQQTFMLSICTVAQDAIDN